MKILGHTGSEIYIGHFQSASIKNFEEIVEEKLQSQIMVSNDIAVITAFNDKSKAIAALQLEHAGQSYVNACPVDTDTWSNVDKIKYFVEVLQNTTTDYSLLVDAYDVIFFQNLDEAFISKFEEMGCDVLYNATKNNYPNIDFNDGKEEQGEFKYLNAGVVFGKTSRLLEIYTEMLALSACKEIMNPFQSEQLYVKMIALQKEYVKYDYECKLFQTFSKAVENKCGNTIIIT